MEVRTQALLVGLAFAALLYALYVGGVALIAWYDEYGYRTAGDGLVQGSSNAREFVFVDEDDRAGVDERDFSAILRDFYLKYNPDLVGHVPNILLRYQGREDELFAKLEQKYGEAPVSGSMTLKRDSDETDDEVRDEEDDEDEDIIEVAGRSTPKVRHNIPKVSPPPTSMSPDEDMYTNEQHIQQESNDRDEDDEDDEDREENKPAEEFMIEEQVSTQEKQKMGQRSSVRVICVGMEHTGVDQVHKFLTDHLGLIGLPHQQALQRLWGILDGRERVVEFDLFDGYQVISGLAVSLFFQEIIETYPSAKVVVAVRNVEEWFMDAKHFSLKSLVPTLSSQCQDASCYDQHTQIETLYHAILGNTSAHEFLWKKRYREFYSRVLANVPRSRRKLMDLYSADASSEVGWKWLEYFVNNKEQVENYDVTLPLQPLVSMGSRAPLPKGPDAMCKLHLGTFKDPTIRGSSNIFSGGQMQVLGAGFSNTGEIALASALRKLGYSVVSNWQEEMKHTTCSKHNLPCTIGRKLQNVLSGGDNSPNFGFDGIFHGVDAVVGIPAGQFVDEIVQANPDVKVVLTVRSMDAWWRDIECHISKLHLIPSTIVPSLPSVSSSSSSRRSKHISNYVTFAYGSAQPKEFMYYKFYRDYVEHVARIVPSERLLLLDVTRPDAWSLLCSFLRTSKCTQKILASRSFPSLDNPCS